MTKHDIYKEVILDGCSIEVGELSLCCINKYYKDHPNGWQFQVHSDHSRTLDKEGRPYSELFDSLNKAVTKFIEIKEFLYGT